MSIIVMSHVWAAKIPEHLKLTMLALADHAHDDGGSCRPGVKLLAWKTGKSERAVHYGLRELEDLGYIVPLGVTEGGDTVEYQIDLEKLPKQEPFIHRRRGRPVAMKPAEVTPLTAKQMQDLQAFTGQKTGATGGKGVQPVEKTGATGGNKGVQPVVNASFREPDTEPVTEPRERASLTARAAKGISLAPIADAFRALGLKSPTFLPSEIGSAQLLLSQHGPESIAECWRDVESGAWGDQFARDNLSFRYLSANNRLGNWERQRKGAGDGQAISTNGNGQDGTRGRTATNRGDSATDSRYAGFVRKSVRNESGASGVREDAGD